MDLSTNSCENELITKVLRIEMTNAYRLETLISINNIVKKKNSIKNNNNTYSNQKRNTDKLKSENTKQQKKFELSTYEIM